MADIVQLMQSLETIYCGSYLKGNGNVPMLSAETANLHAAALSAWSLLLTLISPGDVYMLLSDERDVSFSPYVFLILYKKIIILHKTKYSSWLYQVYIVCIAR